MTRHPAETRRPAPGFTLVEVMVTLIVIAMLSGLALVAAHKTMKSARRSNEQQVLLALKQSITHFKNEFGFLPPLVHDNSTLYAEPDDPTPPPAGWPALAGGISGPVRANAEYGNTLQPVALGGSSDAARLAADNAYLQGFTSAAGNTVIDSDYRFSNYSLSYYLMGLLDVPSANNGKAIDGVDGPAMTAPREDGTFTQRNKRYEASYDVSRETRRIGRDLASQFGITFNDRWGKPIRYYRWEPRPARASAAPGSPDSVVRTLIPRAVGDPRTNPKIRGARYALVITGEDRKTDMRTPIEVGSTADPNPPLSKTIDDDIVEVEE